MQPITPPPGYDSWAKLYEIAKNTECKNVAYASLMPGTHFGVQNNKFTTEYIREMYIRELLQVLPTADELVNVYRCLTGSPLMSNDEIKAAMNTINKIIPYAKKSY